MEQSAVAEFDAFRTSPGDLSDPLAYSRSSVASIESVILTRAGEFKDVRCGGSLDRADRLRADPLPRISIASSIRIKCLTRTINAVFKSFKASQMMGSAARSSSGMCM